MLSLTTVHFIAKITEFYDQKKPLYVHFVHFLILF